MIFHIQSLGHRIQCLYFQDHDHRHGLLILVQVVLMNFYNSMILVTVLSVVDVDVINIKSV